MYTVCLVEDEEALSNVVKLYLDRAGYETICFTKGKDAISYIGNKVDLWILDIMLGDDISGYDVIKAIREKDENVPVIFTSARDQEIDKIFGLELGSDDYMTKPYSSKELVLRVNNIIKRVYKDKCFSREEILNSVWGSDSFGNDRAVDDLIRRLRKKLPKLKIDAIYGYGYRLS